MEIQISRQIYNKVMHWVNKSNDEVSGFGKVIHYPETGVFEVQEVHLLKQKNGGAHTDIDGADLAKLMFTTKDEPGELKWWWHSHVNMPVFWSSTDKATIEELGAQGWIAATVFNKKEEMRSAICYKYQSDFGSGHQLQDEINTFIMDPAPSEEEKKEWDEEYEAKVEKRYSPPAYTPSPYAYGGRQTQFGNGYTDYDDFSHRWNRSGTDYKDNIVDATKPGSLLRPVKTRAEKTQEQEEEERADREAYMQGGWLGYGARREAQALGLSIPAYLDILVDHDSNQMKKIDYDLTMAVALGVLPSEP